MQSIEPEQRHVVAGTTTSAVASVVAVGLILLGPADDELRSLLDHGSPWLDDSSGDLICWLRLSDPQLSEERFRRQLKALRLSEAAQSKEWAALVAARHSVASAEQHETKLAADHFGLDVSDLPCVVFTCTDDANTRVRLALNPRAWGSEGGLHATLATLVLGFHVESIRAELTSSDGDGSRALQALVDRASTSLAELADPAQRAEQEQEPVGCAHGSDFTWVTWHGRPFNFKKGNQAEVIRVLWEEAERAGFVSHCGLGEESITAAINTKDEEFSMRRLFRGHPALDTFICSPSKGVWALQFEPPR